MQASEHPIVIQLELANTNRLLEKKDRIRLCGPNSNPIT